MRIPGPFILLKKEHITMLLKQFMLRTAMENAVLSKDVYAKSDGL